MKLESTPYTKVFPHKRLTMVTTTTSHSVTTQVNIKELSSLRDDFTKFLRAMSDKEKARVFSKMLTSGALAIEQLQKCVELAADVSCVKDVILDVQEMPVKALKTKASKKSIKKEDEAVTVTTDTSSDNASSDDTSSNDTSSDASDSSSSEPKKKGRRPKDAPVPQDFSRPVGEWTVGQLKQFIEENNLQMPSSGNGKKGKILKTDLQPIVRRYKDATKPRLAPKTKKVKQ